MVGWLVGNEEETVGSTPTAVRKLESLMIRKACVDLLT